MMSETAKKLFTFSLLALAVYAVWEARKWSIQASLMPLLIGIPTVFLLLLQFLRELSGRDRVDPTAAAQRQQPLGLSSLEEATSVDSADGRLGTVSIICWILAFVLGIWLLGFQLGMTLLALLYLKGAARETWFATLSMAGAIWLGATLFFDCTMHIFFAEGQLFVWLGFALNPFYTDLCQQFMGIFR